MSTDFEIPRGAAKPIPRKSSPPAFSSPPLEAKAPIEDPVENAEPKETGASGEPVYSEDELLKIFDEIIFSGEYRETINVRGRLSVTFKTRTAEEISEIQRAIDAAQMNLISSVESLRSILNIQYSLVNYQGRDVFSMKPEEKNKFIGKIPAPIVGMMLMALGKFDHKVAMACKEGEENF